MKKLPTFRTQKEEISFWKEHSISEYWEELAESPDTFKRPKLTPVTLKFDPLVLKKLKMLSRKRGISYNAYIRLLLAKGVEKEILQSGK